MERAPALQSLLLVLQLRMVVCASLRFSVKEEQEPGTLAGSLSLRFPPPYQLLNQDYLWMDRSTGSLYTTERVLDREALCPEETGAQECILLHNAIVGPHEDLIQFPVIIEDINDNGPVFENNDIHLNVSEDAPLGAALFLDVQARDRDAGHNGKLRYDLPSAAGVFSLAVDEEDFMTLVVQAPLDRETKDEYRMALVVSDCGLQPLSATATLIVTVIDVNDNCPRFSSDSPRQVTVSRDSARNAVVARVRATDPDSGPNAAIIYSLHSTVSERAKGLFSIDRQTGDIRLQGSFHDSEQEVVLKASASGPQCAPRHTQVVILVLPKTKAESKTRIKVRFIAEHRNQTVVIPENQPPTVLALLEVEGDGRVKGSSLAIRGHVPFTLSPQNGKYLLSTSQPLDFETQSKHHISVVAEGPDVVPALHVIDVLVSDVNDNVPRFLQTHYQLEVEENKPPAAALITLSASDADSGNNGRVSYRLEETGAFSIDPASGVLSASASLDREQQASYQLTVFAKDCGSPELESHAAILVRVLDQNDNPPLFLSQHFIFFISENDPQFALVGKVGVTDPDEGVNGDTEMYVANHSGPFVVDNLRGALHTTASLDREACDHYELHLLARDNGHPTSLTSSAKVTIFVEDINDNRPKVLRPNNNFTCLAVSPATATGTMVTKIYATDEDSGLNSEITYTVVDQDLKRRSTPFHVEPTSGNITLARRLLVGDLGMHHLLVMVSDAGKPAPLHATVWVNLLVNESAAPCQLDRPPSWSGPPDRIYQTPSRSRICEVSAGRSAQLTLMLGAGMMVASLFLLLVTMAVYLKHRRNQKQKKKCQDAENKIPLRIKDKCENN
ncbi:protocadherin-20 [Synchiropus splendidus]|uniref:protocadherin-20 n=1 Tax=Synchiropus splendidus TaxID=270530 RepID=UPI00237D3567|nr:protocadherin-20 [Synchiropus splendidus]